GSGRKKTFSDQWGLHNQLAVFNPAPVTSSRASGFNHF
ncbi:hypothetical protein, partial [Klebsiella pneumoniae]